MGVEIQGWQEWIGPAIGALTLLGLLGVALRSMFRFLRKANHFLDDVMGMEARPGRSAVPGVVEQVSQLREKQFEMGRMVDRAYTAASQTNDLMKRHMENGAEIMAVGVHNDALIVAAIKALGGEVGPFLEYPQVDTGKEPDEHE